MTQRPHLLLSPRAACAWLFVAVVTACGGGVDSGGTGGPTTSFASGAITGFGSVIVAGVRFDERGASIADADGNARSRDALGLGMTIEARGTGIFKDAEGNDASVATSIVVRSEIVGAVSANDVAGRTAIVLGQTVETTAATVFDGGLAHGQASLRPGDVVEIHGSVDAVTGRYVATRVERRTGVAAFTLRGTVSALDRAARTFSIGPTRISYAALGAVPASVSDGAQVRVTLAVLPGPGGVWVAQGVGERAPDLDDRDEAKLEGLVSAFTSTVQFSIDGRPVDARAAAFPDGTSRLVLGARVKAEGTISGGVLVASRVRAADRDDDGDREFQVRGAIASLDTAGRTFVVRNVVVSYSGAVDFRDGSATGLRVGREVDARGMLSSDGTRLQATRIDFRD